MKSMTEAIHCPASMENKGTIDPPELDFTIEM
jgi:hypothetical protein